MLKQAMQINLQYLKQQVFRVYNVGADYFVAVVARFLDEKDSFEKMLQNLRERDLRYVEIEVVEHSDSIGKVKERWYDGRLVRTDAFFELNITGIKDKTIYSYPIKTSDFESTMEKVRKIRKSNIWYGLRQRYVLE